MALPEQIPNRLTELSKLDFYNFSCLTSLPPFNLYFIHIGVMCLVSLVTPVSLAILASLVTQVSLSSASLDGFSVLFYLELCTVIPTMVQRLCFSINV